MAKIIISEQLKDVLTKMDNNISKLILSEYIDVENIGDEQMNCLGIPQNDKSYISYNDDKQINYLDISQNDKSHISYITKERKEKIDKEGGNYWAPKLRYCGKPGGVVKKMFLNVSPFDVESFSNEYNALINPIKFTMKVVKGEDIPKYYNQNKYVEQRGNLGGSCMKDKPSEFFDIYSKNDESINMIVMVDDKDMIYGRSILWIGDDFKLMDRVYIVNDIYYIYFYNWAKDNGYYFKTYNNYSTPLNIRVDEEFVIKKLQIKLNNIDVRKYPYLDTFKWLDTNSKIIYNYIPRNSDSIITLSDHMGGFGPPNYLGLCEITNELCSGNSLKYLDYIDKFVLKTLTVYSEILDRYILKDHSNRFKDDYIFNDEYDHLNGDIKINYRNFHYNSWVELDYKLKYIIDN